MDRLWLPVSKHWRLNERHYGGLTGLNKQEMIDKVGAEQVKIWRRSFDIPPPPLPADSPCNVSGDRRYAGVAVPASESLKDTIDRVLPYYDAEIVPRAALRGSGCSSRRTAIRCAPSIKHLSNIGDEEIVGLEIPTGEPIVYELGDDLIARRPLLSVGALSRSGRLNAAHAATLPLYPVHFLVGAGHDAFGIVVAAIIATPIATLNGKAIAVVGEVAVGDLVDQPRGRVVGDSLRRH